MLPERCLSRLHLVGATLDRSSAPLVGPTASAGPAVRTSARPRCSDPGAPLPSCCLQKPVWRRRRAPGMNFSHLCAVTQVPLRGNWLLFLPEPKMVADDLRNKVPGSSCSWCSHVLQNLFGGFFKFYFGVILGLFKDLNEGS